MKKEGFKNYLYQTISGCLIVGFGILVFFAFQRTDAIRSAFSMVVQILMPIIFGLVIAYLTNPIYNYFFQKMTGFTAKKIKNEKHVKMIAKGTSIAGTILIAIAVVVGLIAMVIPQVTESIANIIELAPESYNHFMKWFQKVLEDNTELRNFLVQNDAMGYLENWFTSSLMPNIRNILNSLTAGILVSINGAVNLVKNLIIGVIVAIYVLGSKETFMAQGKKIIYSMFKEENAKLVIDEIRYVHKMFGGFINGKLLDSLIIGIICFLVMSIFKWPYVMLISVIIGVTNIIPFFGPFIGAIPSALFILMESPIECIYFLIFIIILQQFDGNILGPKILGDSTGLSSFWVLFSILLFGGLFGFVGMIIGVPTFAVIYDLISRLVNHGLRKRKLSTNTEEYREK